jgi:hypothetical protein
MERLAPRNTEYSDLAHIFTVTHTATELPGPQCICFFTGKQLFLFLGTENLLQQR